MTNLVRNRPFVLLDIWPDGKALLSKRKGDKLSVPHHNVSSSAFSYPTSWVHRWLRHRDVIVGHFVPLVASDKEANNTDQSFRSSRNTVSQVLVARSLRAMSKAVSSYLLPEVY